MASLSELQDELQRAILSGDNAVLAHIPDSPRERRDVLLDVYRNAYVLRLAEVLRNDYEALAAYLGDDTFEELARDYISSHPSRTPNARWFGAGLPAFLAATEPYAEHAQIAELATIEKALADAFDAADAPVLQLADVSRVAPEDWPTLLLTPHPSVQLLTLATNALAIWTALSDDAEPPAPTALEAPATALAWRGEATTQIRALSPEEAMMWREAAKGTRFSALCELLATYDDPDTAAQRAATHLGGWLSAGLLSAARTAR